MELKEKLEARVQSMDAYPDDASISIVPEFAITMQEAQQRVSMLRQFIRDMMVEGTDYGTCPGTKKPTLFKPGAEKLCDIFGFSKQVEVMHRMEDWSQGIFHYEVKVTLISKRSGCLEAEGIGCCNNREKKFVKSEPASIVNTILKMAKKRAFVDAILTAARCSDQFTQDMEDADPAHAQQKPVPNRNQHILQLVRGKGIPFDQMRQILQSRYQVNDSRQLSEAQMEDFIHWLQQPSKAG